MEKVPLYIGFESITKNGNYICPTPQNGSDTYFLLAAAPSNERLVYVSTPFFGKTTSRLQQTPSLKIRPKPSRAKSERAPWG